jgi:hypothetical protein
VVALVTLGSLSGVLAASVLVAAVLSSPPATARLRRRTGTSPSGTVEQVAHVAVATGGPAAVDVVRALSDAQLCRAWRRSLIALRQSRSPEELEQVAVLRRACLDEMELRDPVAFASWLASGARAVGGPESFLGRGRRPESA